MYRSKKHVCGTLQGYTNRKLGCGFLSSKDKTQKDQVMRNVRRISSATGASRTTMLVFSFLAAVLIYLCSQAAPALYRYYELESQAVAMARRGSIVSDQEILTRLSGLIKQHRIPANPHDITIYRGPYEIEISLDYNVPVTVPWVEGERTLYTFEFHLRVRESISLERQRY